MMTYTSKHLELSSQHRAVPLCTPTWRDDCKMVSIRIRCDTEELALHVMSRIQYALTFFSERTHTVYASRVQARDSEE
jgi:hypothetical protein